MLILLIRSSTLLKHVNVSQYCLQVIKCTDLACCEPFRSSYLQVIPDRFLPPPVFLHQSDHGLSESTAMSSVTSFCPSIFMSENQLKFFLNSEQLKNNPLPYDLFCPSLQGNIKDRIKGAYFGSQAYLKQHASLHKSLQITVKKIRPIRIAAKRARKRLIIWSNTENEFDTEAVAEWVVVDFIDNDEEEKEIPDNKINVSIMTIDEAMECPWEEDIS